MLDLWINFADGYLLVFAVDNLESFNSLEQRRARIMKLKKDTHCPIVIVGNKCDLVNERVVTESQGMELAKKWGAVYIETSAKTDINCKECFQFLAKSLMKSELQEVNKVSSEKKNKKCCLFF